MSASPHELLTFPVLMCPYVHGGWLRVCDVSTRYGSVCVQETEHSFIKLLDLIWLCVCTSSTQEFVF